MGLNFYIFSLQHLYLIYLLHVVVFGICYGKNLVIFRFRKFLQEGLLLGGVDDSKPVGNF